MIHEYADRISAAFMSSAIEMKELRMISVVIGSTLVASTSGLLSRQYERPARLDGGDEPRGHHGGRGRLFDDRGPVDGHARLQVGPEDDRRLVLAPPEDHSATAFGDRSFRAVGERSRLRALQFPGADETDRDELHRGSSVRVSMAGFVGRVESLGDLVDERSSANLVRQQRDLNGVFLTDVPDVDETLHSNRSVVDTFCVQQLARLRLELHVELFEVLQVGP